MATVLQEIINEMQTKCALCSVKDCQSCKEHKMIIRRLKESLPAEEQQIRAAWEASLKRTKSEIDRCWTAMDDVEFVKTMPPDIDSYITNLKK